jgi:NAD(P)-dependent dehydrogenase (short-subunit alcohol dehydrogenase family)
MSSASALKLNKIYDLNGRVALVTGGGTGIGLMIAQGLAANGAKVYITGRRKNVLETVAAETSGLENGSIVPLPMDVTDKDSILRARDVISEKEGRLHILVNNAGQVGPVSSFLNDDSAPERKDASTLGQALFDNESFDAWADLYRINTSSIFFVTNAFLGLLDQGSRDKDGYTSSVINITSISGIMKLAQRHFCYNSAKAAASHLTKMLSTEYALKGIPVRVNAIAPGVYESEMTYDKIEGEEFVNRVGSGIQPVPAKRAGTAQEMAGTVLYLASPAGCYTNGQEIVIDGGFLAVNPSRN